MEVTGCLVRVQGEVQPHEDTAHYQSGTKMAKRELNGILLFSFKKHIHAYTIMRFIADLPLYTTDQW